MQGISEFQKEDKMKKTLAISLVIILIAGCSMKQPMPSNLYFRQASLLMHMERCKQAGYLTSYDYYSGFQAMAYIVNTWDYDEKTFKNKFNEISLNWKDIAATSSWCEGTKKKVNNLIANANNHKRTSAKNRVANQQAMASISQSLQELGQASQQAGQQALSSVQNMQVVSPTITYPNNTINTNALPAPDGYEKTVVPSGTVGVLRNSSFSNGAKLCEYSNGRAIRIQASQTCPNLLQP
jgi:hypothetical protein